MSIKDRQFEIINKIEDIIENLKYENMDSVLDYFRALEKITTLNTEMRELLTNEK